MSQAQKVSKVKGWEGWEEEENEYEKIRGTNVDPKKWAEWQRALLDKVIDENEKQKKEKGEVEDISETEKRRQLERLLKDLTNIPTSAHANLIQQFLDESYRYGPLQPIWDLPGVTDIQIFIPFNEKHKQIIGYKQNNQRKIYNGPQFRDYDHTRDWLNHHLSRIGMRFDPAKIELNGMLPGGERIHIVSGPTGYSLDNPYQFVRSMIVTIRLFSESFTLEDLTTNTMTSEKKPFEVVSVEDVSKIYQRQTVYSPRDKGIACKATMDFVRIAGHLKLSKLIVGGTGSGKTTFFNADTINIGENEMLLIIEESPEMQPQVDGHVIRLYEREGVYTQTDAMKSALRMFPSRIYISELRDAIAYLFMRALINGHDGSGSTIHASSCQAGLDQAVELAAGHPSAPDRETIRRIMWDRLGYVVHMNPTDDGRTIRELCQVQDNGDLHTVSRYVEGIDPTGKLNGYYEFIGPTDEFVQKMIQAGIEVPSTWKWRKSK